MRRPKTIPDGRTRNGTCDVFLGAALLLGALATGCATRAVVAPIAPPLAPPDAFEGSSDGAEAPDRWWTAFGDPGLNQAVDQALDNNLDLRQAWARMDQARHAAALAGSARWPQANASLSASRTKSATPAGVPAAFSAGLGDPANRFGINLSGAYEVDVWRRNEALALAADADADAAAEAGRMTAEALAARVADVWFGILEARARQALLEDQVRVNATWLELVTQRYRAGLADVLAVRQQRQQLLRTEAQRPLVDSELASLTLELDVLRGQMPSGAEGTVEASDRADLPTPSPPPALGVPSDLLQRRADLRAARRRLEAQDRRVAAAVADRLPTVRLAASGGLQAREIANLFDELLWNLAAEIAAPILDGGRRKAEVARQRARLEELMASFGQILLQAVAQVEGALRREAALRAHIDGAERQLEAARAVEVEARGRYQRGVGGFLPVLDALRRRQETEIALLGARRRLLSERIRLHQALGGSWTEQIPSMAEANERPPTATEGGPR